MIIGAAAQFLLISGIRVVLLGLAPTITLPLAAGMAIGGVLGGSLGAGLVTVGMTADAVLVEEVDDATHGDLAGPHPRHGQEEGGLVAGFSRGAGRPKPA
jgi:hypothetical protein